VSICKSDMIVGFPGETVGVAKLNLQQFPNSNESIL
jgi:tRNA A37 methylthiotransferase MiaB